MQERPDIAQGFVKENKEKVALFWKQVTFELNSAGPPVKGESDWKKAWNDQKRYVRRKAADNKKYKRGTGGGPNRTQILSPSEEAIFQLIGMKEAVEGVETGQCFGLNPTVKRKRLSNENEESPALGIDEVDEIWRSINEEHIDDIPEEVPVSFSAPLQKGTESVNKRRQECRLRKANLIEETSECSPASPLASPCDMGAPINKTHQPTILKKTPVKMTTKEVALKELQIQEEVCNKISEAVDISKKYNAEVQSSFKKIYRSLDRIYDQKKCLLKETQRHNIEMEKLRKCEIESKMEKNRKIIELEELKLEIMRNQK